MSDGAQSSKLSNQSLKIETKNGINQIMSSMFCLNSLKTKVLFLHDNKI